MSEEAPTLGPGPRITVSSTAFVRVDTLVIANFLDDIQEGRALYSPEKKLFQKPLSFTLDEDAAEHLYHYLGVRLGYELSEEECMEE